MAQTLDEFVEEVKSGIDGFAFVGRLFSFYSDDDGFMWFRILGYGLVFANRERMDPPFSVRYGHTKEYRVGRYGIQLLTPDKRHAK